MCHGMILFADRSRSLVRMRTDTTDRFRQQSRSRGGALQEIRPAEVGTAASIASRLAPDRSRGGGQPRIPAVECPENLELALRRRNVPHSMRTTNRERLWFRAADNNRRNLSNCNQRLRP